MARKNEIEDAVVVAGVDVYPERIDAYRSVEDNVVAEGRARNVDQIPDYHDDNPTLDGSTIPSQDDIDAAITKAMHDAQPKVTKVEMTRAVEDSVL